jgi:two-component system response regulator VanR
MIKSILVADDEREIVELIGVYLENEGYHVVKAYDGNACMECLDKFEPGLVILDVMMPGIDGIEVCRKLRESRNIPVIMLSAKSEPMDKILGLATGADDYMTKPFHPLELLARVKAQLRRFEVLGPASKDAGEIVIKDLVIVPDEHLVLKAGVPCSFTAKEFEILKLLAGCPNRVFSMEEIFERVWGEDALDQENTVMVHIRNIRGKLGDDSRHPKYLRTIWGVGYKIEK